jgi:hypothetical protein
VFGYGDSLCIDDQPPQGIRILPNSFQLDLFRVLPDIRATKPSHPIQPVPRRWKLVNNSAQNVSYAQAGFSRDVHMRRSGDTQGRCYGGGDYGGVGVWEVDLVQAGDDGKTLGRGRTLDR